MCFNDQSQCAKETIHETSASEKDDANTDHTLLPNIIDQKALFTPEAIWAEYPKVTNTYENGYAGITYRQLSRAINGAASWLELSLGRGHDFETLAYMGPNDARYQILLVAAIKAGYKIFFTSPRNSVAAQIQLFRETQCRTLLVPNPQPPSVINLLKELDMRTPAVPELENLLHGDHDQYRYAKTYQQSSGDPIFVLHTSGSTDIPKPLNYTHEYVAASVAISNLEPPAWSSSFNAMHHNARIILLLPPFHIAGLYFSIINGVYNDATTILPLPNTIPTIYSLGGILSHIHADSAFLPPSILEDLSKDSALLSHVASKLSLIFWSGGPVSQATGSTISTQIRLHTCYGSSEYGAFPELLLKGQSCSSDTLHSSKGDDNWNYFSLQPALNAKFRHRGDNRFELVLPRDPTRTKYLPPFLHFPRIRGAYHTRDLFEPHPSCHGFWAYVGRTDDIVVFSNGEKTNPVEHEAQIVRNAQPCVKAALVFGAGRAEAGLLIELSATCVNKPTDLVHQMRENPGDEHSVTNCERHWVEKLWPVVEKSNETCPAHARVAKEMILFTEKGKPFLRAGKGTVQRGPTLRLYAEEIERLYAELGEEQELKDSMAVSSLSPYARRSLKHSKRSSDNITAPSPSSPSQSITANHIAELVREVCHTDPTQTELDHDANFFTVLGMDSLQVLRLSRTLRKAMPMGRMVQSLTIIENPTVRSLEEALRLRDL